MRSPLWAVVFLVGASCGPGNASDAEHAADREDGGHREGVVELTAGQVDSANIRSIVVGPGVIETELRLTATVTANADAQAHVNPKVGGLVVSVSAQLGRFVSAGETLCELDSVELGRAASDYLAASSAVGATENLLERERALLARGVDIAQAMFDRESDLAERQITTQDARLRAEQALQEAQFRQEVRTLELEARLTAEQLVVASAERVLEVLGLVHEAVEAMLDAGGEAHVPLGGYVLRAPREGVVVARDVTEGEFVGVDATLFEIQDLSKVWVNAWAHEKDLTSVRVGASASLEFDAFPGAVFHGVVGLIGHRVDPVARVASIRIELDNELLDQWPEPFPVRPGMYGRASIVTGTHDVAVAVPESAIVHEPSGETVFVETGPGTFEVRAVTLGRATSERVEIATGVQVGERIVVSGTFVLKSVARADELGDSH